MLTDKADLHTVAMAGTYEEFLKKFKETKSVNLNQTCEFGSSVLHHAIENNNDKNNKIALFLLKNDIDVNIKDSDKKTSLHYACLTFDIQLISLIIDKGADIHIKDIHGNTPLWTAVLNAKGFNYDIVKLLMKYNPDVNSKNKYGKSPLDFAKQINDEKMINILLNK